MAQRVVDLETQLASWGVERGAPHVAEEHLHGDLHAIYFAQNCLLGWVAARYIHKPHFCLETCYGVIG